MMIRDDQAKVRILRDAPTEIRWKIQESATFGRLSIPALAIHGTLCNPEGLPIPDN